MTLEQLRIFIAVAEQQHMTRAAQTLNLTQSATSAAIAALETRHGVLLFDRVGRRIILNQTGQSFLEAARATLAHAAQAERMLDDLAGLARGSLRLAASQTVANYWLPEVMQRFHHTYPGVTLQVAIGNSKQVAAAVTTLAADIGVIEGTPPDDGLQTRHLPGDRLALVVAPSHEWAQTPPNNAAGLCDCTWVLREPGSGTRAALAALLHTGGLNIADLPLAFELPSNEAVCTAIEAGAGVGLLSELVVRRSLAAGTLRSIPYGLPRRDYHILWHKDRQLNRAEQEFIALARNGASLQVL